MSPQRVRGRQHERTDATLEASIAACGAVSVSDVRRQRALFVELAATPLTLQRVAVSAAVNGGHVDLEVRSLRETLGTERALELVIVGVRDAVSRRQVVAQALGVLEHPRADLTAEILDVTDIVNSLQVRFQVAAILELAAAHLTHDLGVGMLGPRRSPPTPSVRRHLVFHERRLLAKRHVTFLTLEVHWPLHGLHL